MYVCMYMCSYLFEGYHEYVAINNTIACWSVHKAPLAPPTSLISSKRAESTRHLTLSSVTQLTSNVSKEEGSSPEGDDPLEIRNLHTWAWPDLAANINGVSRSYRKQTYQRCEWRGWVEISRVSLWMEKMFYVQRGTGANWGVLHRGGRCELDAWLCAIVIR